MPYTIHTYTMSVLPLCLCFMIFTCPPLSVVYIACPFHRVWILALCSIMSVFLCVSLFDLVYVLPDCISTVCIPQCLSPSLFIFHHVYAVPVHLSIVFIFRRACVLLYTYSTVSYRISICAVSVLLMCLCFTVPICPPCLYLNSSMGYQSIASPFYHVYTLSISHSAYVLPVWLCSARHVYILSISHSADVLPVCLCSARHVYILSITHCAPPPPPPPCSASLPMFCQTCLCPVYIPLCLCSASLPMFCQTCLYPTLPMFCQTCLYPTLPMFCQTCLSCLYPTLTAFYCIYYFACAWIANVSLFCLYIHHIYIPQYLCAARPYFYCAPRSPESMFYLYSTVTMFYQTTFPPYLYSMVPAF